jgi:hypothetical protein
MSHTITTNGWLGIFKISILRRAVTEMSSFSLCIGIHLSAPTRLETMSMALWSSPWEIAKVRRVEGENEAAGSPKITLSQGFRDQVFSELACSYKLPSVGLHLLVGCSAEDFRLAGQVCQVKNGKSH